MSANHYRIHAPLAWTVVAVMGIVQGLYGHVQYFGDEISYLNVSRAVSSLDWKLIFDPMWTPGYPALIALTRELFPNTATGEWYAIVLLNCIIFLAAYASLRYLIRQIEVFRAPGIITEAASQPAMIWTACLIFLSYELDFDTVARVTPDLLVSALFLVCTAQSLRIINRPSYGHAAILGLILGLACWVKGIFLSYSIIFLFVLFLDSVRDKSRWGTMTTSVVIYLLPLTAYLAAISWSYGQFTFGASGELNYAFHVNGLPHWTNWQGGPSQFGRPIHHSTRLLDDLPVFSSSAPFHSTYPPYNNLSYWYRGFHHFFSFRNQIAAIIHNIYVATTIAKAHPIVYAFAFVVLTTVSKRAWRLSALKAAHRFWPMILPALLGTATYLLVHVEDHYLSVLLLVLTLLTLTPLLDPSLEARRPLLLIALAAYVLGAGAELKRYTGPAVVAALHRQNFHQDLQWRLAAALKAYGLKPNDAVALIGNDTANYRCTWAYISHVRIIAEFGALPWQRAPWDRTRLEGLAHEAADKNPGEEFWQLPTAQRQRVIDAFRTTGARAVVSLFHPTRPPGAGWTSLADTGTWIYSFDPRPGTAATLIGQKP